MNFDLLIRVLPAVIVIGGIVGAVYLIRRFQPAGLAVWISAPLGSLGHVLNRFGAWLGGGSSRLRTHADTETAKVLNGSNHPVATGLVYIVLAGFWLVSMGLYLVRNANIVLTEHREAVERGVASPNAAASAMALAEVFAPVLLTAAAGIIVVELVGVTDHLPFLRGLQRRQKLAWIVFAILVLGVAMVMQLSVARQEMSLSNNTVVATIEQRRAEAIPPLPLDPTPTEVESFNRLTAEFDQQVAQPALDAYSSTVGEWGWRAWLPIGAALLDFVFAFTLIPALVLCWVLLVLMLRGGTELLRSIADGMALLLRVIGGTLMSMLNLTAPAPTATPGQLPAPAVVSAPRPAAPGAPTVSAGPGNPGPRPTPMPGGPAPIASPVAAAASPAQPPWSAARGSTTQPVAPAPAPGTSAPNAGPVVNRWNPFAVPRTHP